MAQSSTQETLDRTAATARRSRSAHAFARGLGWLSLGLGLAEALAPRALARATGMAGRENLIRAYGLREIAAGIGILNSRQPGPWIWARAGGDALDLATLGSRLSGHHARGEHPAAAVAAVLGVGVLDLACARALRHEEGRRREMIEAYRRRSGLPRPPGEMRGAARADFQAPAGQAAPAPEGPGGPGGSGC